jgi:LysM repeat protein
MYDRKVTTKVYFDSGSEEFRKEAKVTLDEIIAEYKKNPDMIIELNGHTDNVGSEALNLALSKSRSEKIFNYLVKKGVPPKKVIIHFFGQSKPVSDNISPYGRQFNRRVDIILKDDEYIKYLPASIYIVRPQGTFYSISRNFGVSIEDIRKWNGMGPEDVLQAYKPLRVLNPKGLKPNLDMLVELNASLQTGFREYTVQSGDTLDSISQKFNVPVQLIMETNNMQTQSVSPGQKILIYVSY